MASLEEHERFFVKILYDKGKTACLNRGNFQLHIAATTAAAARFETPSMANYRGTEGQAQSSELFGTIVHGYLTMRLSLTKTTVINAAASPEIKKLSVVIYTLQENMEFTACFFIINRLTRTYQRPISPSIEYNFTCGKSTTSIKTSFLK